MKACRSARHFIRLSLDVEIKEECQALIGCGELGHLTSKLFDLGQK
jgi:hypothetical protein